MIVTLFIRYKNNAKFGETKLLWRFAGYLDQEPDSCKGCERKYTYRSTRTGIFTSPMFPDDYPDHTMCCYFFQAKDNGRVRIEFDIFSLEGSSENE